MKKKRVWSAVNDRVRVASAEGIVVFALVDLRARRDGDAGRPSGIRVASPGPIETSSSSRPRRRIPPFPRAHLQAHDVFVFQRAEHLHLAQRGFAHVRVVVRLLELLHRDRLPGLLVPALQHHPVRALAHHPEDLVLVHRTADAAQCRAETESWL